MSIAFDTQYNEDRTYEDGAEHADDKKLWVKFEVRAVKNEFKSNKEGRPIFDEVEYIHIIVPGSRDILITPLDDQYKRRFAERYTKWKATERKEMELEGTILAEVPWMTKGTIAELNASNVMTVEQLAEMSDSNAMKFLGNFKLRERAKLFLEAARGEAPALRLQQELEQRDLHIKTLEQRLTALEAALEAQSKKK